MKLYFPNKDKLIEIVALFCKRNESVVGYLRNQYNAFENFVVAYCTDNQKFLYNMRDGRETGIKYKFRNALFDTIYAARGVSEVLDSREVKKLVHFEPLIYDEDSGSVSEHERFICCYEKYIAKPYDFRIQKDAVQALCSLLYVVRCNIAHTGKASFGPNRAKIERDKSIAQMISNVNLLVFNVVMGHPSRKLACYGTLIDSIYVEQYEYVDGVVDGYIEKDGDRLLYYTYEIDTGVVDVKMYESPIAIDFSEIDAYEGDTYERIFIPVQVGSTIHIANIYERKYSYE